MIKKCTKCGGKIEYTRMISVETYKTKEKNLGFLGRAFLTLTTFGIGNLFVPKYANKQVAIWKYKGKCIKCGKKYEFEIEPEEPFTCEDCVCYDPEFDEDDVFYCGYIGTYIPADDKICDCFELNDLYDDFEDEEEEEDEY